MHRSYQSILPTHNKLLQQKWDNTYYNEHRKKALHNHCKEKRDPIVREAAPMVDTKAPQTYMHLHMKLKKLQLEEERLAMIERDNRILLEKMSFIMRTKGRVDNRNNYDYKSLNREKRRRELLRVTRENQAVLQRILNRKPEYDQSKWRRDWGSNLKFMDNISAFPRDWWVSKSGKANEPASPGAAASKQKQASDSEQPQQADQPSGREEQKPASPKARSESAVAEEVAQEAAEKSG